MRAAPGMRADAPEFNPQGLRLGSVAVFSTTNPLNLSDDPSQQDTNTPLHSPSIPPESAFFILARHGNKLPFDFCLQDT